MIELTPSRVFANGPKADLEDIWRVFVFPADRLGRDRSAARYQIPSVYRSRRFSIRTHFRSIKADHVAVHVWVFIVRRK